MNKFFAIVGIIVVAWIAFGLVGLLVGFLTGLLKLIFWVGIVVGAVYIIFTILAKKGSKL